MDTEQTSRIDEHVVAPRRLDAARYLATPTVPGLALSRAQELAVVDAYDRRYLDFAADRHVLGHAAPALLAAMAHVARDLDGAGTYGHALVYDQVAYAQELSEKFPTDANGDPAQVAFCVCEEEALTLALYLAARGTRRAGIAVVVRSSWVPPGAIEVRDCGGPVPATFWEDKAAFLVEPVRVESGCEPIDAVWLASVVAAARSHGVCVVADERFSAYGRTGAFSAQPRWGITADLTVLGGPGGGGLPFGAVVGAPSWLEPPFPVSPAAGHPWVMAMGRAVAGGLHELLLGNVADVGRQMQMSLAELKGQFPDIVGHFWGAGLLWGLQMPGPAAARQLVSGCAANGLLICTCALRPDFVRLVPPVQITVEAARAAVDVISDVLLDTDQWGQ